MESAYAGVQTFDRGLVLTDAPRETPLAFEEMYHRYAVLMYSVAYRLLGDGPSAEDVVQETLVKAWRSAASYDPERSGLQTWLMTILRRRCIDQLRRRAVRPISAAPLDEQMRDELGTGDPWVETDRTLTRERVQFALGGLPREQRETIELAYFSGYTAVQIAERTETPLGTVKGRMRLGLHKLRENLAEAV